LRDEAECLWVAPLGGGVVSDCANREIIAPRNRFLPWKWAFHGGWASSPPEWKAVDGTFNDCFQRMRIETGIERGGWPFIALARKNLHYGKESGLFQTQVPSGTSDNSPTLQRWVPEPSSSPSWRDGCRFPRVFQSSLRDELSEDPFATVETVGYFLAVPPGRNGSLPEPALNHNEGSFWQLLYSAAP